MQASAQGIIQDTEKLVKDYSKESKEITQKYIEEFGMNGAAISPLLYTDVFGQGTEYSDQFLERTLMTGMDIAQMSHDMLTNFPSYTLSLDPAGN
jgi:hypothetical protein